MRPGSASWNSKAMWTVNLAWMAALGVGFYLGQKFGDDLRHKWKPMDAQHMRVDLGVHYTDSRLPTKVADKTEVGAQLGIDPGKEPKVIESYKIVSKDADEITNDDEYKDFHDALDRARHLSFGNKGLTFAVIQLAGGSFYVRQVATEPKDKAPRYNVYSVAATDAATKAIVSNAADTNTRASTSTDHRIADTSLRLQGEGRIHLYMCRPARFRTQVLSFAAPACRPAASDSAAAGSRAAASSARRSGSGAV